MSDSTCDLYDKHGEAIRVLQPIFRDFGGKTSFGGIAVTIKCFEDNSRVKEVTATPGQGKVLVVDGGGSLRCALLGDLIAKEAVSNGWEGVIICGCVRDTAVLAELPLGVKALAAIPRKSVRRNEGQLNIPVEIGGAMCSPGDRIVADRDGILILAPEIAGR